MKLPSCVLAKTLGMKRPSLVPALSRAASSDSDKKVRIGCSSGFWGDTPTAVPQLVYGGNIQYLVSDYLSEITMSLLVAARNKNPQLGFTPGKLMQWNSFINILPRFSGVCRASPGGDQESGNTNSNEWWR